MAASDKNGATFLEGDKSQEPSHPQTQIEDSHDDLSTFLEEDKGQEPSHPPTQIEDFDDISTYVIYEAANGAPLMIPPSTNLILIRDKEHDLPIDVFADPKNGVPLQLTPALDNKEYTIDELFGGSEASSGCSKDPVLDALDADSGGNSQLGNDNSPDVNFEGMEWISMGLEHLFVVDDALGSLITEHKIVQHHDTYKQGRTQKCP